MHLDHKKLTELLVEATGLAESTIEKNLQELVEEIKHAIADGDGYELEGFGIFSGIGGNIIFIPSDELSTEINYKYVGMEPIEMDSPAVEQETELAEAEEVEEAAETEETFEDPFAGLLDDVAVDSDDDDEDDDEPETDEEETDPDEEHSIEEENPLTDELNSENSLDDEEEHILDEIISSEEKEETEVLEANPGVEKWGIDSYRDDDDENRFSGLLGSDTYTGDEDSDIKDEVEEDSEESELSIQLDEEENDFEQKAKEDDEFEDFDDPFKGLNDDKNEPIDADEDRELLEASDGNEEIIPVIKNISSGSGEKENVRSPGLKASTRSSRKRERQSSPILLWILLAIIVLGGGVYGLGYFGLVSIPGIDSFAGNQVESASATTFPESNISNSGAGAEESVNNTAVLPEDNAEAEAETEEQEAEISGTESENTGQDLASDQPLHGLMGTPNNTINNGYTIVIYSFSRQSNAQNERQKLLNAGYRALVFPIPHAQYGTIYRVSLGQFETQRDAALAAENLTKPYSDDYIITNIQPN